MMKVFLGGTCSGWDWRNEIIPSLKCDCYNPVVKNWNEDDRKKEIQERENADYILYTITNGMKGVYSIAEIVDDSNKHPEKLIFCNLYNKDYKMKHSLEAVEQLVKENGGTVLHSLESVVEFLNNKVSVAPSYLNNFNDKKVKDDIVKWIKDWFAENGPDCKAVVGISGGKDSTVAAALCVEALGSDRVVGVLMPNGEQSDIKDAYAVVNFLNIDRFEINIETACKGILNNIKGIEVTEQTEINLPPRIRMATLYAISQSVKGRVVNTCNLSENYIGYSTRWGDSVGDFSPLGQLTSDEVVAVGDALGLPKYLVHKTPSDGLCGKTDEENFGFPYEVLNDYIRTGECNNKISKEKIDKLHKRNLFKMKQIPEFEYKL